MSNDNISGNISRDYQLNGDENRKFYKGVMTWLAVAIGVAAGSAYIIGPLVPAAFIMPLALILIIAMIGASFSRKFMALSNIFIFVIPIILGVLLYPALASITAAGDGMIIVQSLLGTAVAFGTAAVLGWKSDKNMSGWHGPLFAIVIGLIVLSLLNAFLFQLSFVSYLISALILVVFTIYSFIDVQAVRKRSYGEDAPPQYYALNIFLDIYNIFSALLNLLR